MRSNPEMLCIPKRASQQPLQGRDAAGPACSGVLRLESCVERSSFLCFWLLIWMKELSLLVPGVVIAFPETSAASTFQLCGVGKG